MGGKPKTPNRVSEKLTPKSFRDSYDNYGRFKVVWLDTRPDLPLSPGPGVMRWDLRPDDWLNFWPELLFHPCAYLHANNHPLKTETITALEMTRTLPEGFDWRASAPKELHQQIAAAFVELQQHPENAAPTGGVLIDSGTLYSVDTVGRPFAVGKLVANEGQCTVESVQIPAEALTTTPVQKSTKFTFGSSAERIIDELCELLERTIPNDSPKLIDLLSVLVRAPDSESTKRKIAQILDQKSNAI